MIVIFVPIFHHYFCALGAYFNYFAMFVLETVFMNKLFLMASILICILFLVQLVKVLILHYYAFEMR